MFKWIMKLLESKPKELSAFQIQVEVSEMCIERASNKKELGIALKQISKAIVLMYTVGDGKKVELLMCSYRIKRDELGF